jgi:hypothetical protein
MTIEMDTKMAEIDKEMDTVNFLGMFPRGP